MNTRKNRNHESALDKTITISNDFPESMPNNKFDTNFGSIYTNEFYMPNSIN